MFIFLRTLSLKAHASWLFPSYSPTQACIIAAFSSDLFPLSFPWTLSPFPSFRAPLAITCFQAKLFSSCKLHRTVSLEV